MIFTHVHQIFLHEHDYSVFTGNKVTNFRSRSLSFSPGEDVRRVQLYICTPSAHGCGGSSGSKIEPRPCVCCVSNVQVRHCPGSWLCCLDKCVLCRLAERVTKQAALFEMINVWHGHIATAAQSETTDWLRVDSSVTAAPPGHCAAPDPSTLCSYQIIFWYMSWNIPILR